MVQVENDSLKKKIIAQEDRLVFKVTEAVEGSMNAGGCKDERMQTKVRCLPYLKTVSRRVGGSDGSGCFMNSNANADRTHD